jgi:hypothetical protein
MLLHGQTSNINLDEIDIQIWAAIINLTGHRGKDEVYRDTEIITWPRVRYGVPRRFSVTATVKSSQ